MPSSLPPGFTLLQVVPRLESGGVEEATLDLSRLAVDTGARSLVASRGGALEGELARGGGRLARLEVDAKDPARLLANAGRLAALIRREKVDLIHVRSRAPAFSALLAGRWTDTPVVTTYHGIYGARGTLKRWYNGVMTRGDLVIANSAFTRDHLLAQHAPDPNRVAVIPEGIDTRRFDPSAVSVDRIAAMRTRFALAESAGPILLVAARLTGWKGQSLALEAFSRVRSPATLVLAGASESDAYHARLRVQVASLGIAGHVRFAGPVDDMPAALAVADLVLAPSLKAESFGRGVVEAMAMGRPVIASALGAHRETVIDGDTGWIAPPGEPRAWTQTIERALEAGPERSAAMGRRARARAVANYDVNVMAEATFAAYRAVLARR